MRVSARIRAVLSELSRPQLGICVLAGLFLITTILRDIPLLLFSSLLRATGFGLYVLGIPITFVGTVLPVLAVLWLFPQVNQFGRDAVKKWPSPLVVSLQVLGYLGILLTVLFLLAVCGFFELFFPLSVLPLITAVCGILWVLAGLTILRHAKPGRRLTVVALVLCLILSVKFADWNSRRPFIRSLLRIRAGMTADEVDRVMGGYMEGTGLSWPPIWNDEPKSFASVEPATSGAVTKGPGGEMELAGSKVYRHSLDGAYNADWGVVRFENGKVVAVEFMRD